VIWSSFGSSRSSPIRRCTSCGKGSSGIAPRTRSDVARFGRRRGGGPSNGGRSRRSRMPCRSET
jgi:hypothetical protein